MKKLLTLLLAFTVTLFISCSSDENGDGNGNTTLSSITLSSNLSSAGTGDLITFATRGNNGTFYTSSSTFYINGSAISGRNYTPTEAGTLEVYATYTNSENATLTSQTIQIVVTEVINFNKRVLIEDFTGTWCGYCPRVSYSIEQVKMQTENAEIVAIHRGSDPYNFSAASTLETQIGLSGYPTAMLNRTTEWTYPETSNISQAVGLTQGTNPRIGAALETSISGSTATVTVKVKFGQNFNNLKLVVYALEDNLIYNQTNYTSYYGGASTIVNFEHDHVVRAVLTSSILGENITGSTNYDEVYTKTFTYTIPGNVNSNNLTFTAVVLDNSKKALNARTASNSETQDFEIQ